MFGAAAAGAARFGAIRTGMQHAARRTASQAARGAGARGRSNVSAGQPAKADRISETTASMPGQNKKLYNDPWWREPGPERRAPLRRYEDYTDAEFDTFPVSVQRRILSEYSNRQLFGNQ